MGDERDYFAQCIELEGEERAHFLAELAERNPDVAERVRRLVAAHDRVGPAEPVDERVGPKEPVNDDAPSERRESVGPYRLIQRLGEGGMGVVYLADQREPVQRRVALKLLRPGLDSEELAARFDNERRTVALMSHPGIARMLDAGTTSDGLPYFVMEYVPGRPITEFADGYRFSIEARVRLFLEVLDAVRHAHLRGVIHRDLKPSNVLAQLEHKRGVVKVIDFGVAKIVGDMGRGSMVTRAGTLLGTPNYMSPEQADGRVPEADTRSDVYSLGMLLYELLVGALPLPSHRDPAIEAALVISRIKEGDLPPPSSFLSTLDDRARLAADRSLTPKEHRKALSGELDWIVRRAIDRDIRRRYESASEFSDDLRRYLGSEPVEAGPGSVGYRAAKFVRKHAVPVAAGIAAILVGLGYTLTLQRTNSQITDALEVAQIEARRASGLAEILTALVARPRLEEASADTALARALIERGLAEADRLRDRPEQQGLLYSLLGGVYGSIGDYDAAIAALEEARRIQRSVHGADHLNVAETERQLGENLRRVGRLDEAEEALVHALLVEEGELAADHTRIVRTLTELHFVHRERGDYVVAQRIIERALEMQERLAGGAPDADVANSVNLLGAVQRRAGFLPEARANYERALEIRRALSPQGPSLAIAESLNNLGVQANVEGDYVAADTLLAQASAMFAVVLGETHRFVSLTIRNRALPLRELGREDEALTALREQVALQTSAAGPYDLELAALHRLIGVTLRNLARFDEAEEALQLAELNVLEAAGEDHPFLGNVLNSRARLYLLMGDPEGGVVFADRAIDVFERSLSRLHPDAMSGYRTRGELLASAGRDDEARADLEEAFRRAEEAELASDMESAGRLLVAVYDRMGDREGADSLRMYR